MKSQVFNTIGAADLAAQNCTCDKIVPNKQVFVTYSKKEISFTGIGKNA